MTQVFELFPKCNKAARLAWSISGFVGMLAGRTQKVAAIEEINEAATQGWAGILVAPSGC